MSGLDPDDWTDLRALGHRIVDDMIDHLRDGAKRPVWKKLPDGLRAELRAAGLPRDGRDPGAVYDDARRRIVPYVTGNTHPRFMGWVHGGGTAVGMLADLLASGLNANCGGRDHVGLEVERQVIGWAAAIVGMPAETSGLLVTGSSMANLIAVLVARFAALGPDVRRLGLRHAALTGYAAVSAHGCIPRAFDMAGLGTASLRLVATDAAHRLDVDQLAVAVARDRAEGQNPFFVAASAGTVDCGAVDDLERIADYCAREHLWFHVDGAFGALAALSDRHRHKLRGIERADSLAFDFHKWAQVPYDAGCILVRDPDLHIRTFAQSLAYLAHDERGLAGNPPWPCDLGPDLSRGFRALKVAMTLETYGADALATVVDRSCEVAQHLAARIEREPTLELLAPVALNIVCFRVRGVADRRQADIVAELQEAGIAAPSTTIIDGVTAIRAAIVNHRTDETDVDALVKAILSRGSAPSPAGAGGPGPAS